jgi:hypothetical protein
MDILEMPLSDLFEQIILIPSPEGIVPLQHHKEKDP